MAARTNSATNGSVNRIISVSALLAAAFTTAFPPQAAAQSDPDSIKLFGVLRDFHADHPDFGLSPADAPAHYAGNISFFIDGDFKPSYVGAGAEVATQWRDLDGRPIAPHLFNFSGYNAWPEGTGVYSTGSISMGQGTVIDSWDSSKGDYTSTQRDNAIVGSQSTANSTIDLSQDATIQGAVLVGPGGDLTGAVDTAGLSGDGITGAVGNLTYAPDPLPVVQPDLGASVGDVTFTSSATLSTSMHCDAFTVGDSAVLRIEGNVEIVCDGRMTIGQKSQIELAPGATLTIFTNADVQAVSQSAMVNANTGDPSRVTFYHMSSHDFRVQQFTEVYATVYAPDARVYIQQDGEVYGRVLSGEVIMSQGGQLHIDEHLVVPTDACGTKIGDTAGSWSAAHAGAVDSADTFRHWFRTVPGQNVAGKDFIELMNDGAGVYEYATPDFTLADGKLLGNEGMTHNRNFTLEIGAVAQYDACRDQFFEFTGDGDAWMMVNDRLVLDLGGLGAGKSQIVDFDRLGFADGEVFIVRFFYAQRTNNSSAFSIRTNMNMLTSEGVIPDTSGLFD